MSSEWSSWAICVVWQWRGKEERTMEPWKTMDSEHFREEFSLFYILFRWPRLGLYISSYILSMDHSEQPTSLDYFSVQLKFMYKHRINIHRFFFFVFPTLVPAQSVVALALYRVFDETRFSCSLLGGACVYPVIQKGFEKKKYGNKINKFRFFIIVYKFLRFEISPFHDVCRYHKNVIINI